MKILSLVEWELKKSICRNFVFEVHGEKEKLLGNLDLGAAVAAFLHVCFVLNLKYPKVTFLPLVVNIFMN